MFGKSLAICVSLAFAAALAAAPNTPPSQSNLSASQIADKKVAARGGLQAWRAVQTISIVGKLSAGGNQRSALPLVIPDQPSQKNALQMVSRRPAEEVQLPFVMALARVRKMRFELEIKGQTAVQVYDGANGWKLRPFLNRREVEPFTAEELKRASLQADVDGPLVDYPAKGTQVELEGVEKVEGRHTYELKLTLKNGESMQFVDRCGDLPRDKD